MRAMLKKLSDRDLKDIAAFPFAAARLSRRMGLNFPTSSPMGAMSAAIRLAR
mgnify:CR=1 FL=1